MYLVVWLFVLGDGGREVALSSLLQCQFKSVKSKITVHTDIHHADIHHYPLICNYDLDKEKLVCVCIFCIVMLKPLWMSTICCFLFGCFSFLSDNIFHLNVHYVCYTMLVQRFEPQGRCFTNFHYYKS